MIFSSLSQSKVCVESTKLLDQLLNARIGSKFYYLRNILHDYPDDKCRALVQNLIDAMGKDSLILIDEMVLPDSNVPWQATQLDLTMMVGLASAERTREQWYQLLDSAGLKIVKIYTYTISLQDSIIVVVPK